MVLVKDIVKIKFNSGSLIDCIMFPLGELAFRIKILELLDIFTKHELKNYDEKRDLHAQGYRSRFAC